jgi:diguanylate cyclase (GGDEF)-like protein
VGALLRLITSHRTGYALLGALLAVGAPLGLVVVRSARAGEFSLRWLGAELSADALSYLYVFLSSEIVFTLFGLSLGVRADILQAASSTDVLTGLGNRRAIEERLREEIAGALRHHEPISLLLIDVDHLKEVNDRAGHRGGDVALKRVADAIRFGSRDNDVAARWGGDEFALLAPKTTFEAALSLAERIRGLLEGGPTVSIGVATFVPSLPPLGADALIQSADEALYRAKQEGRNCVRGSNVHT